MRFLITYAVRIYLFVPAVCFLVFLTIFRPIMNSDDNFYVLYTLAGAYGTEPSNVLHYTYEWHPLLFWPVARLFSLYPHFNWYSALLLVMQFAASSYILFTLNKMYRVRMAMLLFTLIFLFFQASFLFSMNHSNTSFMLGISGGFGLVMVVKEDRLDWSTLCIPFLLLLFSALLRIHTATLCVVLSMGMAVMVLPVKEARKILFVVLSLAFVMLIFHKTGNRYYENNIPNIQKERSFRESFFFLANHPINSHIQDESNLQVKNSFINSWFLFDPDFILFDDITRYVDRRVFNRLEKMEDIAFILYWVFINSRVYLLLFMGVGFAFVSAGAYRELKKWLLIALFGLSIFGYLHIFMKANEGIYMAIGSFQFLSAALLLKGKNFSRNSYLWIATLLLVLSCCWIMLRMTQRNRSNNAAILKTRTLLNEVNAHPQTLFIVSGHFADNGFYIWDIPSHRPLPNLINKELVIMQSYEPALKRFHIQHLMKELPERDNVFVTGKQLPMFTEYYQLTHQKKVEVIPVPGFQHLQAYQVKEVR